MRAMARAGLAGRGTLYVLLGVLALGLALSGRKKETDQRGAFEQLAANPAGWALVLAIAIALAAYAIWRLADAVIGDDDAKTRVASVGRGIIYGALSVSAFGVLVSGNSSSQRRQQQEWTATLMKQTGGRWLVGLVGVVVLVVGVVLVVRGAKTKFDEDFPLGSMSRRARKVTRTTGLVGTIARGIVVGMVGVLFLIAAVQFDPQKARGVDGALRQIRDAPVGPYLLALVAIGLVMFGLFGFCEARWRKL
jgi:amino acid transporter